jgi:hypothetical protein
VKARGWVRLALLSLAVACVLAGASAFAAQDGDDKARAAALGAPALMAPADDAVVNSVPGFSWRRVRRAAKYEFQFSADARFRSTLASFDTLNTSATVDKTVFDGNYYWRVRAVDANRSAGKWSPVRTVRKRWSTRPEIMEPAPDARITYPTVPLVLRWSPTPYAFKYEVVISADPTLAGNIVGNGGKPIETAATAVSVPAALSPGRYYWAVTPMDGGKLKGRRSEIGTFVWDWPSTTNARVNDLWGGNDSIVDPQFDWDAIPGAARYDLEVNSSQDFAPGSKVCCAEPTTGTSLAPTKPFPNNTYYWRVRARDIDGNAGVWNRGPDFVKFFVPGAPNLRLRDNVSDSLPAGSTTSSPVIAWDPVPGASSYDVQVVPKVLGGCNWSESALSSERWDIATSSTAWTALGTMLTTPIDPAKPFERDIFKKYEDGKTYCVRVRSRGATDTSSQRVVGDWNQVGGLGGAAFTYSAPAIGSPPPGDLTMPEGNYLAPVNGSVTPRMPLFTWMPVAGACQYVVGVFADESLTKLVEQAVTRQPAYAPRLRTYPDETTSYYWAVLPVKASPEVGNPCDVVTTSPGQNNPRSFQKRSVAPVRMSPADGADVAAQPMFRWSGNGAPAVEAARDYRLQVATDPSFGNPLDDVTTAATAYTSSTTYPADAELFWRVRANDENGLGLAWSTTGTFRRRLPIPVPSGGNPAAGEILPVLSWSPVPGAVSYDFHVEEEDGDKNDFTLKATAASFTTFHGLGVFRWQVRANFPRLPFGTVPSGWSPVQTFTRFIEPPPGASLTKDKNRLLLTWDPSPSAMHYRVDFSETNSFNQVIDSHRTDNTNYAPRMSQPGFTNGGSLYWRVAAMDEGNNVGGYATGKFRLPRAMRVTALGILQRRKAGMVTVTVTGPTGRPIRGATVRTRGAGSRSVRKRTGRRGSVRVRIRPRRSGSIIFIVRKRGYRAGKATLRVG